VLCCIPPRRTPRDTPRWRVLLPFSREFVGTEQEMRAYRKAAVRVAEAALGLPFARESYKLSQSYYYGPIADKDRLVCCCRSRR
jgi:hypothetical protein